MMGQLQQCQAEQDPLISSTENRSYGPGYYPKPTIFHPSAAEISLHKAGTHICLLEKFFPDVIKVYWKEKNGDTILESQQGNTMKTDDTYMKFSWLTLQLINTSAYYTYLLLLLKSLVYFAVISFCLVRRTAVCDHGKSS
ncbi:T-cell receptor gamma chain C region C10.5 [Myotis brandtii]|nr:T-cell receptor gamma chain C region C10.5 [Myotis brandtii]